MNVKEWIYFIIKELSLSSELKELFIDVSLSFKCHSILTSHCINVKQHFFKSKFLSCFIYCKLASMSFSIDVKLLVSHHFIKDCTSEAAEFYNESALLCILLLL